MPEPGALLPPLALAACVACVAGAGALANCSVVAALLKSSRNGLSSIIIQLAVADILILATLAGPELWFYNSRTWSFGSGCCIAYRGFSVFASTASSYLTATVALHTIATVNLEEKAIERKMKRNRDDEDEEMRSSHHSLVASSDSSTPPRNMNLDYRLVDTRVRVTPPTVFIWILSASLSIPEFVLATTINVNQETTLCTALDSHHKVNMNSILATFSLLLPGTIMCVTGVLVILKLKSERFFSNKEMYESVAALKLSLYVIGLYCVLCVPRSIVSVYSVYSRSFSETQNSTFEMEQMDDTISTVSLAFSSAYTIAAVLRPVLSMLLLPKLRKVLTFGTRTKI